MKTTIYEIATRLVERGYKFHVDFKKKSLAINGKYIIKEGVWNKKRPLHNLTCNKDNMFAELEALYSEYKHSTPSERSMSKTRRYFRALKEQDLTDEDMMYGTPREVAQIKLELAILMLVLDGIFVWDSSFGTYFWQSQRYRDFVILKDWIEHSDN